MQHQLKVKLIILKNLNMFSLNKAVKVLIGGSCESWTPPGTWKNSWYGCSFLSTKFGVLENGLMLLEKNQLVGYIRTINLLVKIDNSPARSDNSPVGIVISLVEVTFSPVGRNSLVQNETEESSPRIKNYKALVFSDIIDINYTL